MRQDVGDYYIVDFKINAITRKDVDPEQMGRDLGVLKEFEQVVD
jgi:hypothetical protein